MPLPPCARALRRTDDHLEGVLSRNLGYLPDVIWRHLIEPHLLPLWLAAGQVEPRRGGVARLDFGQSGAVIDSLVTESIPGQALDYSWSAPGEPLRPLRWRLREMGGGETRLLLSVRVPASEDAARALAGWDAHLEMLATTLEGVPTKFPFAHFQSVRAAIGSHIYLQNGRH